jgi:hypothetical protein
MSFRSLPLIVLLLFIGYWCIAQTGSLSLGGGTTVLAFLTKDSVIITADTKEIIINQKTGDTSYIIVPKIRQVGNVFFAFSDFYELYDYDKGGKVFDMQSLFTECQKKDSDDIVSGFKDFLDNLKTKINELSMEYPFLPNSFKNRVMSGVIIIQFKDETPHCIFGLLILNGDAAPNLNPRFKPINSLVNPMPLGRFQYISSFLASNQTYLSSPRPNMKEKLIKLIRVQIAQDSAAVGCPIDQVVIRRNAYKWQPRFYCK